MSSELVKNLSEYSCGELSCDDCNGHRSAAAMRIVELEREIARLQMELDASCNAEELRQYRHANQFLIANQGAYESQRDNLVKAGNALRDALAFECHKLGDCPREIDAWNALVSDLPNAVSATPSGVSDNITP